MRRFAFILPLSFLACTPPPRAVVVPPTSRPSAAAEALSTVPSRARYEPLKIEVPSTATDASSPVSSPVALFERAGQLLSAKSYRQALALYDRLLAEFPSSKLASPSLYNAGLAHEWMRDFKSAAARYRELMRRFGRTKEALDGAFRLGGCYAELRNWPASAQIFAELLTRKDLSASDRIECLTRNGLAHFRLGDLRAAGSVLQQATAYHRKVENVERIDSDFFVGMAHYYQAAIPHQEFRSQKLDPDALAQTLDDKARLLLLSQGSYIKTIKIKNPYWATAAGFQIGSLYREFYTVLLTTQPDFKGKAEKNARAARIPLQKAKQQLIQAYLEEVHRTVKPLLDKAVRVFEKNLLVGERVGVESEWVQKSRYQMKELKHLLSLPPAAAVKLVTGQETLPEDQPGTPAGRTTPGRPTPEKRPTRSTEPPEDEDEPGQILL